VKDHQAYRDMVIRQHLPHEIKMTRSCRALLASGVEDSFTRNILIECFWLHAYALIEFFQKAQGASLYVDGGSYPSPQDLSAWHTRINNQIRHLIVELRAVDEERLWSKDIEQVWPLIEREIANFVPMLTPYYTNLALPWSVTGSDGSRQAEGSTAMMMQWGDNYALTRRPLRRRA
jgi:hypothetical protein